MNRHAKASSAGPDEGSGKGRGLFRRASGIRGASAGLNGSAAPSGRRRRIAIVFAGALLLLLVLGATLASAVAPTVTVDNASSVEYTSAHVSGKVDPQGEATTYRFQYIDEGTREFDISTGRSEWEFAETGKEATTEGGSQTVEADFTSLVPGTTYYLRLVAENADGTSEAAAAATFTTKVIGQPTVSIEGPTSITGTTAHFTGHIDPNAPAGNPDAFDVNWHFDCNPECPGLSGHITADSSTHTVEADASGLLPGTAYEVTLSASNAGGMASAGPESFSTPTIAPQIVSPQAIPHFTEASLVARINPGGLQTTYRFEYGPTSSYGQSTPAIVILAGSSPVMVAASIFSLSPASEYHFRVVAENLIETVASADQTFSTLSNSAPSETCPNEVERTGLSALLPDCRAYEEVSPVAKHGFEAGIIAGSWGYSIATPDGNGLLYATRGPMGDAVRGLQDYTVGSRGPDGWTAEPATPPPAIERPFVATNKPTAPLPSSDLTKLLFTAGSYVSEDPDTGAAQESGALYLAHDGLVEWLSRPQIPNPEPAPGHILSNEFAPVGASPDLSKAYFWGSPTLLPSDATRAPSHGAAWGMYEYSEGTLRSAGTLPDGTEDPGGAAPASALRPGRNIADRTTSEEGGNQVSRDGSTLFFISPDPREEPQTAPATQLYVRRAGHSTLVSHTQAGTPAPDGARFVFTLNRPPEAEQYVFASPDGSTAYFYSNDVLAAGAPNDGSLKVYRYDVASNAVSYLSGVQGTVLVTSDNGRRFLFRSPTGVSLWDDGVIKTVVSGISAGPAQLAPARATASGSVFVFTTDRALPGFENPGVYRYDVESEQTTCVSCPPKGVVSTGAVMANEVGEGQVVGERGISEDGERIFFETADALVPRDSNGQLDVYEWTPSGLHLISSGRSQDPAYLLDSSASGNDVFIATTEALNPADKDGAYDVYDARVGGGFKQAEPPAPCAGNACQGGEAGAPLIQAPGSLAFSGSGNLTPSASAKPKPKPLTRAQKLSKALKACHRVKGKRARASCERKARRAYGVSRPKSKAKSHKGGK